MQFQKWPHYLREGKPRHLRVNGCAGPETPLGCRTLLQATSSRGEREVLRLESLFGRIMQQKQTEPYLAYLHPSQDQ